MQVVCFTLLTINNFIKPDNAITKLYKTFLIIDPMEPVPL